MLNLLSRIVRMKSFVLSAVLFFTVSSVFAIAVGWYRMHYFNNVPTSGHCLSMEDKTGVEIYVGPNGGQCNVRFKNIHCSFNSMSQTCACEQQITQIQGDCGGNLGGWGPERPLWDEERYMDCNEMESFEE